MPVPVTAISMSIEQRQGPTVAIAQRSDGAIVGSALAVPEESYVCAVCHGNLRFDVSSRSFYHLYPVPCGLQKQSTRMALAIDLLGNQLYKIADGNARPLWLSCLCTCGLPIHRDLGGAFNHVVFSREPTPSFQLFAVNEERKDPRFVVYIVSDDSDLRALHDRHPRQKWVAATPTEIFASRSCFELRPRSLVPNFNRLRLPECPLRCARA